MRQIFSLVLALAFAATPAFAKNDTIVFVGGEEKTGCDVQQELFEEVKFARKRERGSIDGKKILEILHGDGPASYRAGEGQRRGGQYDKAISSYKKAKADSSAPKWVKLYAQFRIAECQRLSGKAEAAIKSYEELKKETKHLLYPRIMIGLGQAHAGAKDWDAATAALGVVVKGSYGLWRAHADYAIGNVSLQKNDMIGARRAFQRLQNQNDDPEMRIAGVVGEGNCYLAEKNYNGATRFFKRIIERDDLPREVAAEAWAGLGDCQLAEAKDGDATAERRGLLSYLNVVVQYAGTPAYAKALAKAATVYDKFGQKAQAEALRRELRRRCPTSSYARELGKP